MSAPVYKVSMILAHHPQVDPVQGLGIKGLVGKKAIGYWINKAAVAHGFDDSAGYPDPADFIDTTWSPLERAAVAGYVTAAESVASWRGMSTCRICGVRNGSQCLGDDQYVWPQGFAHYIMHHEVKPPQEFIDHVLTKLGVLGLHLPKR